MITAGMGIDHETVGASRHAINVAARKEKGGIIPTLNQLGGTASLSFHAKRGRATQSEDHHTAQQNQKAVNSSAT